MQTRPIVIEQRLRTAWLATMVGVVMLLVAGAGVGVAVAVSAPGRWAGLPTVFVPMFADQLTNARLISGAGGGSVVEASAPDPPGFRVLGPSDVPRIRDAVVEVLANDAYRLVARRLAAEINLTTSVGDSLAFVAPLR